MSGHGAAWGGGCQCSLHQGGCSHHPLSSVLRPNFRTNLGLPLGSELSALKVPHPAPFPPPPEITGLGREMRHAPNFSVLDWVGDIPPAQPNPYPWRRGGAFGEKRAFTRSPGRMHRRSALGPAGWPL